MSARLSDTIQALDDMAPTIQEDYVMENGILTITAEDSQSGINFDAVYATDEDEKTVKPSHINKESMVTLISLIGRKERMRMDMSTLR